MLKNLRTEFEQLEKSSREYRAMAELIMDEMGPIICFADDKGVILHHNKAWDRYTHRDPEESLGTGWIESVHPDDKERILETWEHAWKHGSDYVIVVRFRRHDGVYEWFYCVGRPVRDGDGTITNWVIVDSPISDKEALEHLKESGHEPEIT